LAGKGAGVLVGGFFFFGTFSFCPRKKKKVQKVQRYFFARSAARKFLSK